MTLPVAAKEAGYLDGGHEVDRLLSRPEVRNELIKRLNRSAVSMRLLGANAQSVLNRAMSSYLIIDPALRVALSLDDISAKDAIRAADVVISVLARHNKTLLEAAEAEDSAIDRLTLARAVLDGRVLPMQLPPANEDGEEQSH
jgi:hypothetical protein